MQLTLERHASPLGTLLVVRDEEYVLRAIDFDDYEARMLRLLAVHYGSVSLAKGAPSHLFGDAFARYFAGELAALDALPVRTQGSRFQQQVWAALRGIPAGQTKGYGALANELGLPKHARAVGLANGKNPIAIVVPCHRVIGKDGSLTGYAGGTERKAFLLAHEARFAQRFLRGFGVGATPSR
jgi:O-6-methylguanine DNA methyltransferase